MFALPGQTIVGRRGRRVVVGGGVVAVALTLADKGFPALFRNGGMPVNYTEVSPGVFGSDYAESTFATTGTMYYVTVAGNDTTGDGSSGAPWRTIQKAIDTAPTGSRISVGAGRFAPFTQASKSLSIYGVSGQTFVGEFLTEADITWGALASGRQTATLASGAVSGFVDLTLTKRTQLSTGLPVPQVSRYAATATAIATRQAAGDPGVFRATPTVVGAADGRNLAGKADTELLMWRATAAAPVVLTGTASLFAKNITFAGGAPSSTAATTTFVQHACRFLGAHLENLNIAGMSVRYNCTARGCGFDDPGGVDVIDYAGGATMVEIGEFADQCNPDGSNNCSTIHGGRGIRINGEYYDAGRCCNDNGALITATIGCRIGVDPARLDALGIGVGAQGQCEGHYAGNTFVGGVATASDYKFSPVVASTDVTRASIYDSVAGLKVDGAYVARTAARSTADTTMFSIDPSNLATLFTDAGGTTAVSASGDAVARIRTGAASEYALTAGGGITYQTDGSLRWLQTTTANAFKLSLMLTDTMFDEACNIIIGLKSSDTAGILIANRSDNAGSTNTVGDYRNAGALTNPSIKRGFSASLDGVGPTYHVDGSNTPVTNTGTALKAAAFNNVAHVITIRNANLSWIGWLRVLNFLLQFDGNIYGFEISRATTAANLRAREQPMAAKSGATLV